MKKKISMSDTMIGMCGLLGELNKEIKHLIDAVEVMYTFLEEEREILADFLENDIMIKQLLFAAEKKPANCKTKNKVKVKDDKKKRKHPCKKDK